MRRLARKIRFYYRAYQRLELMNKAASLSFYTFISIFPLTMILLSAGQAIISPSVLSRELNRFMSGLLPYQSELIVNNMHSLFSHKYSVSWVGGIALFISAQILYVNLEKIINGVLHVKRRRHFLITRVWFLFWLMAMVFSLFAPVAVEFAFAGVSKFGFKIPFVAQLINQSAFLLTTFSMFCFVLVILPARRVPPTRLFMGGAIFTLASSIGKFLFKTLTLTSFGRYNLVYGSLSTLVLGALWIFYFYNIFLFCVYWIGREHDPFYIEQRAVAVRREI